MDDARAIRTNHHNRIEDEAPRLLGIGTEPEFAIGQRASLLQSPGGNLLWDCVSLLDDETIAEVNARGGIRAIAISHPHFYSSMIEWAECFDAQIFLHSADREWVMARRSGTAHSILGRINPVTLGWANTNQLRGSFWRRHGAVLADRC